MIFGSAKTVTPSNTNDLDQVSSLYIGGSGDVEVLMENGDDTPSVFVAHPVGYMPGRVRRVLATNTTATNILALAN